MLFGLLYAMPTAVAISLFWSLSRVRDDYSDGAAIGILCVFGALIATIIAHILTIMVKSVSGTSRERVAMLFRPLMFITQLSAVIVTVGMGVGLVAMSFYVPVEIYPKVVFEV